MEEHIPPLWSMSRTITAVTMAYVSADLFQVPQGFVTSTMNPPRK